MSYPLPIQPPGIIRPLLFCHEAIKNFREPDFALASDDGVKILYEDCIIILFYAENPESEYMARVWCDVASQTPGPIYGACNLSIEKKVADTFVKLNSNPNHPFHWARLQSLPFIMVYRDKTPQAFYNGERTVQAIINYILSTACLPYYKDVNNIRRDMYGRIIPPSPYAPQIQHIPEAPVITYTIPVPPRQ